jgi:hypothetical protein
VCVQLNCADGQNGRCAKEERTIALTATNLRTCPPRGMSLPPTLEATGFVRPGLNFSRPRCELVRGPKFGRVTKEEGAEDD